MHQLSRYAQSLLMSTANVVTGVWVPECAPVSLADFNNETAANFNPASWDFYQSNNSWWLPGVILGSLCAIGFLAFLGWLTALCCRRHYWKHQIEALPESWGPTAVVTYVVSRVLVPTVHITSQAQAV